ncbi:MAG TPA: hypothetical protein GX505_14450 [Clostridiales bacterium]|nr:hypothetical protein [Clostridiales bacterium]
MFRPTVFFLSLFFSLFSSVTVQATTETEKRDEDFKIEIQVEKLTPEADRWIGDAINQCLSMPNCKVEHQKDKILFYGMPLGNTTPDSSESDILTSDSLDNDTSLSYVSDPDIPVVKLPDTKGLDKITDSQRSLLPPTGEKSEPKDDLSIWKVEENRIVIKRPPEGILLEVTVGEQTTTIPGGTSNNSVEIWLRPETQENRLFLIWGSIFAVFFLLFFFLLGRQLMHRKKVIK